MVESMWRILKYYKYQNMPSFLFIPLLIPLYIL